MIIGFIKIFISIAVFLALYTQETKSNKDHPNIRCNDAYSDSIKQNDVDDISGLTSRRLSTDDTTSDTAPCKPNIPKNDNTKISNVLKDLINKNTLSSSVKEIIHLIENDKKVLVDVVGTKIGYDQALLGITGIDIISCYANTCSMYIPIDKINELASYSQVATIRASMPHRSAGKVNSDGVLVMEVDKAIAKHKGNGAGVTIGVMSDSFNCVNDDVLDMKSGDLPPVSDVVVLADLVEYDCYGAIDAGIDMMQVIHDVAPEAKLVFYTAYRGEADFANGIVQLANAGCNIIVNDVYYFHEPFFQDGITSQAIEQVVTQGVSYVSAVGYNGNNAWDAPNGFVGSGFRDILGDEYHQFTVTSDK